MDDNTKTNDGPMHLDNGKLGVLKNPLPPSQLRGYIGTLSTSHCLTYHFANKHGCRNGNLKNGGKVMKSNDADDMYLYLYATHVMENTTRKVPLFDPTSAKYVWVAKASQVRKIIA